MAEIFNVPNSLTLARVPLGVLVWYARRDQPRVLRLALAAGATDILDGWAARRRGRPNPIGIWLDPLCDKFFVLALLASVTSARRPPRYVSVLIATREILQFSAASYFATRAMIYRTELIRGADLEAAQIGKIATLTQFAATGAMLAKPRLAPPLAMVAAIAGAGAAIYYFRRIREAQDRRENTRRVAPAPLIRTRRSRAA